MVKNWPANAGDMRFWFNPWVRKGKATHSSVLAWKILWTGNLVGYWSIGLQRVGHD